MIVVLKRPFFCEYGRYRADPRGVTMPDVIAEEGLLPSDAKIIKEPDPEQPDLPLVSGKGQKRVAFDPKQKGK